MAPRLQPGERLLYAGHPSWRSALALHLKGLGLTAAAALLVAAGTGLAADGPDSTLVLAIALVGVATTLVGALLKRLAMSYAITNRRIRVQRGLLSRTVQEAHLERLRNVAYRQTPLQRLLRVGDVSFETTLGEGGDLAFSGVANPAEVVDRVDAAGDRSRVGGSRMPAAD